MKARLENAAIRKAVLKAAAQERRKAAFNLFGRGYEPRVTLDRSVAAILRRVFATAMRSLKRKFGRSPIAVAYKVYRVRDE